MNMRWKQLQRASSGWTAVPEDLDISENRRFTLNLLHNKTQPHTDGLIIMLHGLNERSWDTYIGWAEQLGRFSGMAAALMPIAFHMDRGRPSWSRIRSMKPLEQRRKQVSSKPKSVSFINAALSERIDRHPQRFVTSAYQTMEDTVSLIRDIRSGVLEPEIDRHITVHLFGYSIGCSILQALRISHGDIFGNSSKSVCFCGGSALTDARPVSPYILDAEAFQRLDRYLRSLAMGNMEGLPSALLSKPGFHALRMLCTREELAEERYQGMSTHAADTLYIPMEGDEVFPVQLVRDFIGSLPAALEPFAPEYPHDHVRPFINSDESRLTQESLFSSIADWYGSAADRTSYEKPRGEAGAHSWSAAVPTH